MNPNNKKGQFTTNILKYLEIQNKTRHLEELFLNTFGPIKS